MEGKAYKIGDIVRYKEDSEPYKVIGLRADSIEIEGDFSGIGAAVQSDWVHIGNVSPYMYSDAPKWELVSKAGSDTESYALLLHTIEVRLDKPRHGDAVVNCPALNINKHTTNTRDIEMAKMATVSLLYMKLDNARKAFSGLILTRQNHLAGKFN